jgi:hypothetical protein
MGEQADGCLQQAGAGVARFGWGARRIGGQVHRVNCRYKFKRLFESNV